MDQHKYLYHYLLSGIVLGVLFASLFFQKQVNDTKKVDAAALADQIVRFHELASLQQANVQDLMACQDSQIAGAEDRGTRTILMDSMHPYGEAQPAGMNSLPGPAWVLPGKIIPKAVDGVSSAKYGYLAKDGTFSGWFQAGATRRDW